MIIICILSISSYFIKKYQVLNNGSPLNISELIKNEDPQTIFTRSDESGFHSIILFSKKKEAIQFKRWITSCFAILPSIRKYGSYTTTLLVKKI